MERWPYSNVLVYVVHPRDGEGHSHTLHRNYLLPISPKLEQVKDDAPVAGVEHTRTSASTPLVDSEPPYSEPCRMAMSDTMGDTSQGSLDQPAPLRCSTHATQNQPPWRYCNYVLLVDTSQSGILDVWVVLCICLHLISCLCTIFVGSIV